MLQQKFSILKKFLYIQYFPIHCTSFNLFIIERNIKGEIFFLPVNVFKVFPYFAYQKKYLFIHFSSGTFEWLWNIRNKFFFLVLLFYEKCFQFLMIIIMELKCSFWFFWNCLLYLILNRANSMKFWKNSFIK